MLPGQWLLKYLAGLVAIVVGTGGRREADTSQSHSSPPTRQQRVFPPADQSTADASSARATQDESGKPPLN